MKKIVFIFWTILILAMIINKRYVYNSASKLEPSKQIEETAKSSKDTAKALVQAKNEIISFTETTKEETEEEINEEEKETEETLSLKELIEKEVTNNVSSNTKTKEICFVLDGEEACKKLGENDKLSLPTPKKEGYTFDGWYINKTKAVTSSTKAKDVNGKLYAKFTPIKYTISYDLNKGSASLLPREASFDQTITIDNPIKKVTLKLENANNVDVLFTFTGWQIDGSALTKETTFKNLRNTPGVVTFKANYEVGTFTLPSITKEGYTCSWSSSKNEIRDIVVNNDSDSIINVYQVCTPNTYILALNNGVANETISETYSVGFTKDNQTITKVSVPTKEASVFNGYYEEEGKIVVDSKGNILVANTYLLENKEVYASWKDKYKCPEGTTLKKDTSKGQESNEYYVCVRSYSSKQENQSYVCTGETYMCTNTTCKTHKQTCSPVKYKKNAAECGTTTTCSGAMQTAFETCMYQYRGEGKLQAKYCSGLDDDKPICQGTETTTPNTCTKTVCTETSECETYNQSCSYVCTSHGYRSNGTYTYGCPSGYSIYSGNTSSSDLMCYLDAPLNN